MPPDTDIQKSISLDVPFIFSMLSHVNLRTTRRGKGPNLLLIQAGFDGESKGLMSIRSAYIEEMDVLHGIVRDAVRHMDELGIPQWDEPFVISDRQFRGRFQRKPADLDEAAAVTVAWARKHYTTSNGDS